MVGAQEQSSKEYRDAGVHFTIQKLFEKSDSKLGPCYYLKAGSSHYGRIYVTHLPNPKHQPLEDFARQYESQAQSRAEVEHLTRIGGQRKNPTVAGVSALEDHYIGGGTPGKGELVWCFFVPEKSGNVLQLEFSYVNLNGPLSAKSTANFEQGVVQRAIDSLELL